MVHRDLACRFRNHRCILLGILDASICDYSLPEARAWIPESRKEKGVARGSDLLGEMVFCLLSCVC